MNRYLLAQGTLLCLIGSAQSLFTYDSISNHTMDLRNARKNAETSLRTYELHRFREATNRAREQGYSLHGFYHTSTWRDQWRLIVEEQLLLMDGKRQQAATAFEYDNAHNSKVSWGQKPWASVLDIAQGLHLTVAGKFEDLEKVEYVVNNLNLKNRNKINLVFNETVARSSVRKMSPEQQAMMREKKELSEGEVSTFSALIDHCRRERSSGRKALVFYLHNKGGCCSRDNEDSLHVTTWRDAMNAFNIEFPSVCLRALLEGYSTCGMEAQDGTYSGNFMWANCDHVALLPSLWNPFDAYAVEYAIFNVSKHHHHRIEFGETCGYSAHNFFVNHYEHRSPRNIYMPRLFRLLTTSALPPSDVLKLPRNADLNKISQVKKENYAKCRRLIDDPTPYFDRKGDKLGANRPSKTIFA